MLTRTDYCNGDAACPIVFGLSKIWRMTQKYTHYKRLTNFRVAWIPEHRDRNESRPHTHHK